MYYIALKYGRDVIYIYRPNEPKIGDTIFYNGIKWTVAGYIPCEYFN